MTSRILAAALFALLAVTAHAAEPWQQAWAAVKADSAKKCAKTFDTYQMQAVCMDNEKQGYDKMQGDFGMPTDIATKAKSNARTYLICFRCKQYAWIMSAKATNK